MFKIEIIDLRVRAKIGVSSNERKKNQLLKLSLKFEYNLVENLVLIGRNVHGILLCLSDILVIFAFKYHTIGQEILNKFVLHKPLLLYY